MSPNEARGELPAEDAARSPYTGWTRAHWLAIADRLLDAVVPYATADFSRIELPGRAGAAGAFVDGLEGYARTFLLAAFRIAGCGGGAEVAPLLERYARGLAAGTDPANPARWPEIVDVSQQMVEAASIAVALHETRRWLWDELDEPTRDNVRAWLGGFVGKATPENNWVLFQVVVEQFLASVGGTYRQDEIDANLEKVDGWYVGDGWYTDGGSQNFDYYGGWAMHLYPLLWARMAGASAAERAATYRRRLAAFLEQYAHFFGADGAPVHQGRSLTYRFAATAPLWLGALCDCSPLRAGQTRRLASGVLRHFVTRGAPDSRGLLTLGWYGPHLPTTQAYSGPGSPYWASKAFVGLLLPEHHPVWQDTEEPLPIDAADTLVAMPAPGYLVHGTHRDGIVRLINHGSDHASPTTTPASPEDPHYARLTYSTATAPQTGPGTVQGVDSQIALVGPDGTASRRNRIHRTATFDRFASSWYEAMVDSVGYRVETASVATGFWELRASLVEAPAGYSIRCGGYAVAGPRPASRLGGERWAAVTTADGLTSAVIGLHGWRHAEVRDGDANAFGATTSVPLLVTADQPGGAAVQVCLVVLSGQRVDVEELADRFTVEVTDRVVRVEIDGQLTQLRLGPLSTRPEQPPAHDDPYTDPTVRYLRAVAGRPPLVLRG